MQARQAASQATLRKRNAKPSLTKNNPLRSSPLGGDFRICTWGRTRGPGCWVKPNQGYARVWKVDTMQGIVVCDLDYTCVKSRLATCAADESAVKMTARWRIVILLCGAVRVTYM